MVSNELEDELEEGSGLVCFAYRMAPCWCLKNMYSLKEQVREWMNILLTQKYMIHKCYRPKNVGSNCERGGTSSGPQNWED